MSLESLNAEQRRIAETVDGLVRVDAGPGTGKTHTLVERYMRIVGGGVPPADVLMVTFTNNAAQEMGDRLRNRIKEEADSLRDSDPDRSEELMRMIKADGLKIVIVTGSGQRTLLQRLEDDFNGLVSTNLVVTSFDVKHGKPDPEPYLRGLDKAGVKANEAIVVENAPLGVRAAVAAGIFTIAVNTGPLPDKALADEGANLIFPTMTALKNTWRQIVSGE